MTTEDAGPTFVELYGEHVKHPSEVVDSLLDDPHGCLPDPIDLQAGARIMRDLVDGVWLLSNEPYALYDPRQAASIFGDFAGALEAMAEAMPVLDAAVDRMRARGDVPEPGGYLRPGARSVDVLRHAAASLRDTGQSHARLAYNGYVPVAESEHQGVLIAELERRGVTIDEWEPAHPLEDGGRSVAYIDFTYSGATCEIRSEEGWQVRIIAGRGDGTVDVNEIGARWGYSPSIHPVSLIDAALTAVDAYLEGGGATAERES